MGVGLLLLKRSGQKLKIQKGSHKDSFKNIFATATLPIPSNMTATQTTLTCSEAKPYEANNTTNAYAAEAKQKEEEAKEAQRRRNDTNYNPLLHNGITNKDVRHLPSQP